MMEKLARKERVSGGVKWCLETENVLLRRVADASAAATRFRIHPTTTSSREIAKGRESAKRIGSDVQGGLWGQLYPGRSPAGLLLPEPHELLRRPQHHGSPVPPAAPARAVRRFTRVAPRRRFPMTRRHALPKAAGAPAASTGRRRRSRGSPEAAPASGVPRLDAVHSLRACAGRPAPAALPCAAHIGPV